MHGTIAHDIGVEIVSGIRKPGDIFGGEIEASDALDVSRTVYREAIRILAAKGLIESRPKAGTRVNPRSRWNLLDPDVLGWTFEGEPDTQFILDLFELRGIIEPAAAALAYGRRSKADMAAMRSALDEMAVHELADQRDRDADQRFHLAILTATDNEPLAALASSIGAAVRWTTQFKQRKRALPRDPLPDHILVYEAIVVADANAARAATGELLRLALDDMGLALRG